MVNASLLLLNNVTVVYLVQVSFAFNSSAGFGTGIGPCFPLAAGLCVTFTPTPEETIQRQPFLVQYKQQANPLLSLHNLTKLSKDGGGARGGGGV